ncbi:hypothetical protein D3C74_469840 [compost metagenome]
MGNLNKGGQIIKIKQLHHISCRNLIDAPKAKCTEVMHKHLFYDIDPVIIAPICKRHTQFLRNVSKSRSINRIIASQQLRQSLEFPGELRHHFYGNL